MMEAIQSVGADKWYIIVCTTLLFLCAFSPIIGVHYAIELVFSVLIVGAFIAIGCAWFFVSSIAKHALGELKEKFTSDTEMQTVN